MRVLCGEEMGVYEKQNETKAINKSKYGSAPSTKNHLLSEKAVLFTVALEIGANDELFGQMVARYFKV